MNIETIETIEDVESWLSQSYEDRNIWRLISDEVIDNLEGRYSLSKDKEKLEKALRFKHEGISFFRLLKWEDSKNKFIDLLNLMKFWKNKVIPYDRRVCFIDSLGLSHIQDNFAQFEVANRPIIHFDPPYSELSEGCHVDIRETSGCEITRAEIRLIIQANAKVC